MQRVGLALAVALIFVGCTPRSSGTGMQESWARPPAKTLPRKVLLLPADIRIYEVGADYTVVVEAWSKAVSDSAGNYLRKLANQKISIDLIDSPALDPAAEQVLREHIALCDRVVKNAHLASMSKFPTWRERGRNLDYTLGPGLTALAERTGVDAAVLVTGVGYYLTPTAQTLRSVTTAIAGSMPSSKDPLEALLKPPFNPYKSGCSPAGSGGTFVSIEIVDLRTGDLVWLKADLNCATDLRNERDLQVTMHGLLSTLSQGSSGEPGRVTR